MRLQRLPRAVQTAPITAGSRNTIDATATSPSPLAAENEETLVQDDRAAVRPALLVEHKLSGMLKDSFIRVSAMRLQNMIHQRSRSKLEQISDIGKRPSAANSISTTAAQPFIVRAEPRPAPPPGRTGI